MPYFKCNRCAVTLYSAASETRCAECSAPLGEAEHLSDATSLARRRRNRRSIRPWAQPLPADEKSAG